MQLKKVLANKSFSKETDLGNKVKAKYIVNLEEASDIEKKTTSSKYYKNKKTKLYMEFLRSKRQKTP